MSAPHEAMHASAPEGCGCADCAMDREPCPTCYFAWWKQKHPNTFQHGGYAPPASKADAEGAIHSGNLTGAAGVDRSSDALDDAYAEGRSDEAEEDRELLAWCYSKLHRMNFQRQEDALMLDRINLLLQHGVRT